MKKNVIPLVVIALVVAVASTGVFYGLIVSRMDGSASKGPEMRLVTTKALEKGHKVVAEDFQLAAASEAAGPGPVKPEDLTGRTIREDVPAGKVITESVLWPLSENVSPSGIPDGMRAVTVHISDSSSVVKMLKAGDRVDVQALIARNRNGENDVEARTLLQNATVFNVPVEIATPPNQGRSVLTLLSSPQDAERLAAADAGARLRVILRNPSDQKILPLAAVSMLNSSVPQRVAVSSSFTPAAPVELEVSLIEVTAEQLSLLSPDSQKGTLAVSSSSAKQNFSELKRTQKLSVLASSRLVAGRSGEFSWKASDQASLRVRIEPLASSPDGSANLRIVPESTLPVGGVPTTRRTESRVSLNREQGAIVSGLLPADQVAQLREKLSPGARAVGGELLMWITPVAKN